jgi:D-threo-aldose 1-dehydrogenase
MRTRTLRRLTLTELGFGGAPIGNLFRAVADDEARRTVDAAWAAGIRHFDTAPHYGLGLSEGRLGQACSSHAATSTSFRPRSVACSSRIRPRPARIWPRGGFAVPDTYRRRFDFSRDGVHRRVSAVVCGLRSVGEVEAARTNLAMDIPAQAWAELEA